MLNKFVVTENVQRTVAALTALEESAAAGSERLLMLMDGYTGTGKTWTLRWLYTNFPRTVLLHAPRKWSSSWMVEDMVLKLGLASRSILKLNLRRLEEFLKDHQRIFLIDEGDRVLRRDELLETMRDVHDRAGCPIVLVAEGHGRELLCRRSERAWRRATQIVEFGNLTVADVQVMGKELAGLEIPGSQARRLHEHADGGVMGKVMNDLEALERLLKANPGQGLSDKVLELAFRARKAG